MACVSSCLRGDDGTLVIPAQAGIQEAVACRDLLGPRLRGDDGRFVIPAQAGIQAVVPS